MGTLYHGDNLDILQCYLKDESVDLVYLDPPFNSAQNYNAFFHEKDGMDAASQIQAFEDTWHWDIETKRAYDGLTVQPGRVSDVMQAFYQFSWRLRHDGLPHDDGPALGRTAPRPQTHRPALTAAQ